MPVGRLISIAAREAMSHGATSKVAKLAFESTTLPLLMVGCSISPGFLDGLSTFLGLMRDVIDGPKRGGFATEASDSVDILGLRLEASLSIFSWDVLLEEPSEASLSEIEEREEDIIRS